MRIGQCLEVETRSKFSVGKEYRSRLMAGGYPVQNSKASQDIKENQKR